MYEKFGLHLNKPQQKYSSRNLNCRNKDECPLENKWLTPRVICEVDVITLNTSRKVYIGLSGTPIKECYNNHKRDFGNKRFEKSTEISKYIWSLQESCIEFTTHWKILNHVKGMTNAIIVVCALLKNYGCAIILTIYTYSIRNLN